MEEVVVGDVILLEMGDEIPADGRVLKAAEMYVDQSLMTGESEPVRKHSQGQGQESGVRGQEPASQQWTGTARLPVPRHPGRRRCRPDVRHRGRR